MKKAARPSDHIIGSAQYKTVLCSFEQLKRGLEKIRKRELEKYVKKLSGNEKELMECYTSEYIRKIINITDVQIRAMPENSDIDGIALVLAELFNSESAFLTKPSLEAKKTGG